MTPSEKSNELDELSRAALREATLREIWTALGRELSRPDDLILTGLELTGEQFWWATFRSEREDEAIVEQREPKRPPGLESVADQSELIVHAEWFGHAVGEFSFNTWEIYAHDLGDGLFYVVEEDTFNESRRLVAIGARDQAPELFRAVQCSWVENLGWESDAPTMLYARGLREPFMVRAMTVFSGAGAMELFTLKDNDTAAYESLRSLWHGAVTQESATATEELPLGIRSLAFSEELPPGVRGLASSDYLRDKWRDREALEDWIGAVMLRWRDNDAELSADDVEALVTACTYITAVQGASAS